MSELWSKFILGFCKVEFACYNGEPNWLGWILIALGGWFLLLVAFALFNLVIWLLGIRL